MCVDCLPKLYSKIESNYKKNKINTKDETIKTSLNLNVRAGKT